jgi:deoxyribodipyrimidine photo-lyase
MRSSLVWFRRDLRLNDNPALQAACARGADVIPVFVWAPEEEGAWAPGAASRWWLARSLAALDQSLRERGSRLILASGPTVEKILALVERARVQTVFWNRVHEPMALARDARVVQQLRARAIEVVETNGSLLLDPVEMRTGTGGPYRVFTPFARAALRQVRVTPPTAAPERLPAPTRWPRGVTLGALGLGAEPGWSTKLRAAWQPGEAGAGRRLDRFVRDALETYALGRDHPALPGTSGLSPHLHFGEIGPGQVWRAVTRASERATAAGAISSAEAYQRQILWREFAHSLLLHNPHTPARPLRAAFERFHWRRDGRALRAWQRGHTGFPIVDAGMRELWQTGWMHNRVRMVVASFLVKDLLIDWRQGARWFWDTLVDADLANNTFGWQWAAGCGADAAPFFRIFNPVLQGQRFDPQGAYVRRFVPELAQLPARWIHRPWSAPADVLARAGVRLGPSYPRPIVSHPAARQRALAALAGLRRAR